MKKLIATLFLSGEKAVKSIGNREVISDDPVRYALRLIDYNIDALYVLEMSRSDIEHEIALSVIHQIVSVSDVPVYVAGNIKTKFDVENLLEMGCRRVFLNLSKESNIAILKRFASIGFKDNLGGAVTETNQIPMYQELFDDGETELIVMRESIISDVIKSGFPKLIIPVSDIPLDRAMDMLLEYLVPSLITTSLMLTLLSNSAEKEELMSMHLFHSLSGETLRRIATVWFL